jgi:hypothetical protein
VSSRRDLRWMVTPPETIISASGRCEHWTQKKWFHISKWGSIPMMASHRVTKAMMCKTPKGVRLCSSRS